MKRPTTPPPATVGARITHARKIYGLSQYQLADNVGVTRAAISQYELDSYRPRDEVLERLAEVFGTKPEWFAEGKGTEPAEVEMPLSIPEIDLTRIHDSRVDLRNLTTAREWRLPLAVFFEGGALVSPKHLVACVAPSNAGEIQCGDRIVVDLQKRSGPPGVFLAIDRQRRVFLSLSSEDVDILGRVMAYLRII